MSRKKPNRNQQQGDPLLKRLADKGRETVVQVAPANIGPIGRRDASCARGRAMGKKILHPLRGRAIAASAEAVGRVLQRALEGNARKGIVRGEILGRDGDEKSALLVT